MTTACPPSVRWLGAEPVDIKPLHGVGFSGSRVFVVALDSGERFVLKSFSSHVTAERAAWIHAVMKHLRSAGLETVPHVVPLRPGAPGLEQAGCDTVARDDAGILWEAVEFVPGATRERPTAAEVETAVAELARLHVAAATLPGALPAREPSAGVARRREQAARMLESPWRALSRIGVTDAVADGLRRAADLLDTDGGRLALAALANTASTTVMAQTVLRDVWREHVLFDDAGRVSGFIDFHAAGRDTPATDLARLLGSWDRPAAAPDRPFMVRWQAALAAYERVRPLVAGERRLLAWLHATGVVCGLDNWFRWLASERRAFSDMTAVLARIDRLIDQLPESLDVARSGIPDRD